MKRAAFCIVLLGAGFGMALATTKGLNQIVTPDLQPLGQFSLSYEVQHAGIGNASEAQFELGVSKYYEVAYFQGTQPGVGYLATEIGIVQRPDYQIAAGFLGWSTRGDAPQTFLEGGYTYGSARGIVGIQRIANANVPIYGASYNLTPKIQLMSDYLGGSQNFATLGFTYSPNPAVNINPAMYMSNDSSHKLFPYLVVSWNVKAFK